jgi:IclR family transcriptional regulator, pca regulon regulatory protein
VDSHRHIQRYSHLPRVRPDIDPRLSRSLEYGVAILECFTAERPTLRISELADMIEVGRSTTHRYAMTLAALGYLEQDDKRRYRLAHHAARSGMAVIATIRLETPARTILEQLREETGHTVSMGVLDGNRVLYTHRLFGHHSGQYEADLGLGVGAHVPAHCTALGKALLASLDTDELDTAIARLTLARCGPNSILKKKALRGEVEQVDRDGLAIADEELATGVRSIAAPIHPQDARQSLAVEVTVPSCVYTVPRLLAVVGPSVRQAASSLGVTTDRRSYG